MVSNKLNVGNWWLTKHLLLLKILEASLRADVQSDAGIDHSMLLLAELLRIHTAHNAESAAIVAFLRDVVEALGKLFREREDLLVDLRDVLPRVFLNQPRKRLPGASQLTLEES